MSAAIGKGTENIQQIRKYLDMKQALHNYEVDEHGLVPHATLVRLLKVMKQHHSKSESSRLDDARAINEKYNAVLTKLVESAESGKHLHVSLLFSLVVGFLVSFYSFKLMCKLKTAPEPEEPAVNNKELMKDLKLIEAEETKLLEEKSKLETKAAGKNKKAIDQELDEIDAKRRQNSDHSKSTAN